MSDELLLGGLAMYAGMTMVFAGALLGIGVASERIVPISTLGLLGTGAGFVLGADLSSVAMQAILTRDRNSPTLGLYMVGCVLGTISGTVAGFYGGVKLALAWTSKV